MQSCLFEDAVGESSSIISKCSKNKRKTKEIIKFVTYEERCSWIASSWVRKKPDFKFLKLSVDRQNTTHELMIMLGICLNNSFLTALSCCCVWT